MYNCVLPKEDWRHNYLLEVLIPLEEVLEIAYQYTLYNLCGPNISRVLVSILRKDRLEVDQEIVVRPVQPVGELVERETVIGFNQRPSWREVEYDRRDCFLVSSGTKKSYP